MLTALGFDVLARNFRTRHGELDLVAIDGESLVFCEVRARVGPPASVLGLALESIGPTKQLRLRKMAAEWFRLAARGRGPTKEARFDVVAVALSAAGRVLGTRHVRDAF
jgi:putative endonuclease